MLAPTRKVNIGCTMLAGTNKQGVLKPDSQGYYPVPVGAYNAINSMGYLYDNATGVSMFEPGSPLMRQAEKGVLYAEYQHPQKLPGMSDMDYLQRIRRIDIDRACGHIRNYELIQSVDENGRPITLVIAWVKPWGPFEKYLADSLSNPAQNTYFSVRSITMDDLSRQIKYTKEIITHDFVGEGGIYVANKYNAPALEDFATAVEVTQSDLYRLADQQKRLRDLGLESNDLDYEALIKVLGWERQRPKVNKPSYMSW